MQYDDFVSSVQTRGGRPGDETETLVHATLRVLAERLTAREAAALRAQCRDAGARPMARPGEEAVPTVRRQCARAGPEPTA